MGKKGKPSRGKKGIGSSLINKGGAMAANSLADALGDHWDAPEEMLEEAENNKFGPTEPILDLGEDWELVATPGGPVDPWDCERWPGSIWCGGGWEWGSPASFGLGDWEIDGCGIMVSMQWSVLGFEMPILSFGIQSTGPECQPEEPVPPPPRPDPLPGEPEPPIPFPNWNPNFLYALTFQGYEPTAPASLMYKYMTYFAWGPVSLEQGPLQQYPSGGFYQEYYLLAAGISAVDSRTRLPRPHNTRFEGEKIEGWDSQMFPGIFRNLQGNVIVTPPAWGLNGSRGKVRRIKLAGLFDGEFYPGDFHSPETGGPSLVAARIIGCYGKFNHSYTGKIKGWKEQRAAKLGYAYNQDDWDKEWGKLIPQPENIDPDLKTWFDVPLYECGLGNKGPDDYHDGWGKIRGNMKDCCELVLINARRLKRIEAVLQPDKFLKFDGKVKPTKVVGKIPRRLVSPQGPDGLVGAAASGALTVAGANLGFDFNSEYVPIAGYSDAAEALVKMLDRISGFWPATIEIQDIDPNTPGDQSFSLQVHSVSDGFKQALEALARLVMHSSSGNSPNEDPEDNPSLKILAAILTEVGLTHKIAAITQQTTNNIEEFLDYKVRQEEEFLPMAFNPLAEPTWKNLEYTKPTKAQVDFYIKQLLTPSTQDIVVTKNIEQKFLTEWMMEILKHSSASSAALTQQIKSKEDLKKALGTARFNALVQGALSMEQIRRVLGLPSNWDMDDFADNLEDNFHPDENVDAGKHAETKPRPAKEKPRIKDISKNGRRRKR